MSDPLVTSPFFMLCPAASDASAVDLLGGQKFSGLTLRALDICHFFLQPRSLEEALGRGFGSDEIEAAIYSGILVGSDHPGLPAVSLWEERGWSRAAYLVFSQQNLEFADDTPAHSESSLSELTAVRRERVREYLAERPYPPRRWSARGPIVSLPPAVDIAPSIDALFRRRSVRRFDTEPIALDTFANILHTSTRNVRGADRSMANEDPYYLLNAFYSWLDIRVVVQGVKGLARGVYQYHSGEHVLYPAGTAPTDADIANCIQGQMWIQGAGFCVFIVVDWERYMYLFRYSRAYINLLIQVGEFAQELLQASYAVGLGGWLTPAVDETIAGSMLALDDEREDAMYFIKIGPPAAR